MDVLGALLDGPRAERAFLLKAVFAGHWSISVEDEAPLSIVVVTSGAVSVADGTATHSLNPGDVMLTRGHRPCVFADSPQTPTDVRILPGQECVDPHGRILRGEMNLGVRTWATFPPTPRTPPSCSSGPTPARHRSAQGFSLNFRTTW
ncbi:cupin domain-containing protein [Gordonia sp. (in: high G+C Gram-positive bacteria)]|jgi:hypothetical protein|uniref:cupin domain-containing protein n=1 Tax=Gordonia sp. (in: high G+C Gram-positive bacteria) TaxID=84139 RepID=UPI0025B7C89A|nr:cupin domain-containing protein [Gordonia sp. (in: high G+C Gram-positive bacteria)]HMS76285.1 cupin domain-containing protein [Gordonia sp. (in: high G+C Gram-positive bacteria)]HQV19897.1 cupin domain-containing protein [Gordonia sp. (in: high G+C Gram-positive bacteria)]